MKGIIVEKRLGISPDYQYKRLRGNNFLFANWHNNKLVVLDYILKLTRAKSVLDVGTGSGNFELKFAKKLNKIVGVDYNKEAITFLKSKLRENKINNVKLVVNDTREIEKIKNRQKFELIIMVDVIEHLKMADAQKLISKFKSFLKPGGSVCLITPNYKSFWPIIEKILDRFSITPEMGNRQHLSNFNYINIKKLATRNGYRINILKSFNSLFFLPVGKSLSAKLCKLEMGFNYPFGNLLVIVMQYI